MELKWTTMIPTSEDFDFWIKNKLNVLFVGAHGIGKTTLITQAFNEHKLKHRYFSASTMDPWVDFIGVPKEQHDEHGEFLDLVKPKEFRDDDVQALFFDEYNRAPSKVQNAVMELIQFKSINGRKFENLNIVWAAINDIEDGGNEYNVETLDYAQLDRFHVIVKLPSKPQVKYFKNRHGKNGEIACKWWDELSPELKSFISPRRLDYILDIYSKGGNIQYSLPSNANVKVLVKNLKEGLPIEVLEKMIADKNFAAMSDWLKVEVNLGAVTKEILDKHLEVCLPYIPQEIQTSWISKHKHVMSYVSKNGDSYKELIENSRKSPDKRLNSWAKTVKLSSDKVDKPTSSVKSVSAGATYLTGKPLITNKATLTKKIKKLHSGDNWKTTNIDSARTKPKYSISTLDAPEIAWCMKVYDTSKMFTGTTYEKLVAIYALLHALVKDKSISSVQLPKMLDLLNFWMNGMQMGTLNTKLNAEQKTALNFLIAHSIDEVFHDVVDFLDRYQGLYNYMMGPASFAWVK